jgi:1-acyl-sn-glycerol-3-phosphate acyltransferase
MEGVKDGLRNGVSFGISAEGRRASPDKLAPYKKGPAVVAIDAQADIVPFYTTGAHAVWPRGEWRLRPGVVDVHFLPPIQTRGLTYADRDSVVARLRRQAEDVLVR